MLDYFSTFGARLASLSRTRGVAVEVPNIDSHLAAEILQLAGGVAHSSERKFAPVAAFLAGVAVGTCRGQGQLQTEEEISAFIAELRRTLHGEDPSSSRSLR